MPSLFDPVDSLLRGAVGTVFTAAAAQIRYRGEVVYSASLGNLDPDGRPGEGAPVEADTLFDFASLTKLFTTTAFFRLLDAGVVKLDTPVGKVLPDFRGVRPVRPYPNPLNISELINVVPPTDVQYDTDQVTFWHLLTHSSGLPAWLNLREADDPAARMAMCLNSTFSYEPGTQVIYSDVGFILLGAAVAKLYGAPLDRAMNGLVLAPLGFEARYGPIPGNVAPTEWDPWRGRRIIGEVHDENSATLNGVAGHAGLFGTATDVASLAEIYLEDGGHVISPETARNAVTRQIDDRGLGWMMRSPEGSSSGHYFSAESYGHTGFVGNSVWVDPERRLIAALLTNNVFYGRDKDAITAFRVQFHDTIINALEGRL